jgi:hypothetical protein
MAAVTLTEGSAALSAVSTSLVTSSVFERARVALTSSAMLAPDGRSSPW